MSTDNVSYRLKQRRNNKCPKADNEHNTKYDVGQHDNHVGFLITFDQKCLVTFIKVKYIS